MTLANALTFIKKGLKDDRLRKNLNQASTAEELSAALADEGLKFSPIEFEEAFSMKLANCQEPEEHENLTAFKMWWQLLSTSQARLEPTNTNN